MADNATTLRGISELRGFFRTNQTPVYFVSPIAPGRAGARCRRYRRSVSPTRPPNRTCPFLSIRLSAGHAVADS